MCTVDVKYQINIGVMIPSLQRMVMCLGSKQSRTSCYANYAILRTAYCIFDWCYLESLYDIQKELATWNNGREYIFLNRNVV